jgi:RNA polymerase sigma-70 factor (ECF subfamily)
MQFREALHAIVLQGFRMSPVRPKDAEGVAGTVNGPAVTPSKDGAPQRSATATASARSEATVGGARPLSRSPLSGDGGDDDLTLVQRTQAGDAAAFRMLFERYHRRVFAVALGVLKNPQDARDVVQEAFVKVHRHLGSFQGASSFYTWLYRITMNLSIDHVRRKKAARLVDYDDALKRDPDDQADPANTLPEYAGVDPGKTHGRKELAQKIQAALQTLPEYHRQVILLREVEGLSYEEISKVMKVPKGTIMSRLFHARRKMQVALAEYVEGELKPQDEVEARGSAREQNTDGEDDPAG